MLSHRQPLRKGSSAAASHVASAYVCHLAGMPQQPRHFIREWRKFRGLSQDQLAERIGMDKGYLSKIETGKRRYDQPFLEAAATVLQCAPADLLMRDPSDPDGIWSVWDTLPQAQKVQVVEIAKTLKRTGTEG
jgi:DNA-binding Xre family transcriptional regulator